MIDFTKDLARKTTAPHTTMDRILPGFHSSSLVNRVAERMEWRSLARTPMERIRTSREVPVHLADLVVSKAGYIGGGICL